MNYIFEIAYWNGRVERLVLTVIAKTFDQAMEKAKKQHPVKEFISVVNTMKHVTL